MTAIPRQSRMTQKWRHRDKGERYTLRQNVKHTGSSITWIDELERYEKTLPKNRRNKELSDSKKTFWFAKEVVIKMRAQEAGKSDREKYELRMWKIWGTSPAFLFFCMWKPSSPIVIEMKWHFCL